jgi:hypothetical protein
MSPAPRIRPAAAASGLVLLVALLAGGCFNPFAPTIAGRGIAVPPSEPAPKASTPQGALQLLRWCWINLRISEYETLFTDDFEYKIMDVEHADEQPDHRDVEIASARHLFVDGTASEPRARRIDLTYGSALVPIPDQRPGKVDPYHKEITTRVVLKADLGNSIWYVDGNVTFFLVRGDSAAIPADVDSVRMPADTKHWYIERWEDYTFEGGQGGSAARRSPGPLTLPGAYAPVAPAATTDSPVEIHASWSELKRAFLAP